MKNNLRQYQLDCIDSLRRAISKGHKKVVLQLAAQQMGQSQGQQVPENAQAAAMGQAPSAKEPMRDNAGNVAGGRDTNLNVQGA